MSELRKVIKVFLRNGVLRQVSRSGKCHFYVYVPYYQTWWMDLRGRFPWIDDFAVWFALMEGCRVILRGVYCPEFVESEKVCLLWWEVVKNQLEKEVL